MRLDAVLAYAAAQPKYFVYAISDLDGRPVYVGRTRHPEQRLASHRTATHEQIPLRQWVAINAYSFEVLDTYPTYRMILAAEHEYIAYLNPRFNIAR